MEKNYLSFRSKTKFTFWANSFAPYPWKIAIDGPADAGKGTLLTRLVDNLKLNQCSTGDMYRAVTIYLTDVLQVNPETMDDTELASCLDDFSIRFSAHEQGEKHLIISSQSRSIAEDVTRDLQDPAVGKRVSAIAKRPPVRDVLDRLQLAMLAKGRAVMEGRDMWQIAKKDANILIYLYARDEVLITREILRQKARGVKLSREDATMIVTKRNADDNARERGKLLTPTEARSSHTYDLVIDNSDMKPDEVLRDVLVKLSSIKR